MATSLKAPLGGGETAGGGSTPVNTDDVTSCAGSIVVGGGPNACADLNALQTQISGLATNDIDSCAASIVVGGGPNACADLNALQTQISGLDSDDIDSCAGSIVVGGGPTACDDLNALQTQISAINPDGFIDSNLTIAVPTDFATVREAYDSIADKYITDNAIVTIAISTNLSALATQDLIINHPCANRIVIQGDATLTKTIISVSTVTGTQPNFSVTFVVNNTTGFLPNRHCIIANTAANQAYINGVFDITAFTTTTVTVSFNSIYTPELETITQGDLIYIPTTYLLGTTSIYIQNSCNGVTFKDILFADAFPTGDPDNVLYIEGTLKIAGVVGVRKVSAPAALVDGVNFSAGVYISGGQIIEDNFPNATSILAISTRTSSNNTALIADNSKISLSQLIINGAITTSNRPFEIRSNTGINVNSFLLSNITVAGLITGNSSVTYYNEFFIHRCVVSNNTVIIDGSVVKGEATSNFLIYGNDLTEEEVNFVSVIHGGSLVMDAVNAADNQGLINDRYFFVDFSNFFANSGSIPGEVRGVNNAYLKTSGIVAGMTRLSNGAVSS